MLTGARAYGLLQASGRAAFEATGRAILQADPSLAPTWAEFGGTRAMFAGEGSPITQARGSFEPEDLKRLRDFYLGRAASWEAVMSPFEDPLALDRLLVLEPSVMNWESVLVRSVDDPIDWVAPAEIQISEVTGEDSAGTWAEISRRGFFGDDPNPVFHFLQDVMSRIPGRRYLGFWDGQPAAAATAVYGAGVVFCGGAATLPEFRGRGLQAALIARRVDDASGSAELANLDALPGSSSERNALRLGFRVICTNLSLRVREE